VIMCGLAGALVGVVTAIGAGTGLALAVLACACRRRRAGQSAVDAFAGLLLFWWWIPLGILGASVGGVGAVGWAFTHPQARFEPWVGPLFVTLGCFGLALPIWQAVQSREAQGRFEPDGGLLSRRIQPEREPRFLRWARTWLHPLGLLLYGAMVGGPGALWPLPLVALGLPLSVALIQAAYRRKGRTREAGRARLADGSELVLFEVCFLRISDREREQQLGFNPCWGSPEGELLFSLRREPPCPPESTNRWTVVLGTMPDEGTAGPREFPQPARDGFDGTDNQYVFPEFPRESPVLVCFVRGEEGETTPTAVFPFPNPDPVARAAGKRQGVLVRGRWVWWH